MYYIVASKQSLMEYNHPHTIENGAGESLTFAKLVKDTEGDYLEVENLVQPGAGPPMHVHFKQTESLTVVEGKMAYQLLGQEPVFCEAGATATFEAGVAHKFWNAGEAPLICKGWVKPAHNLEYFLTEIYASAKRNGGERPEPFEGAWLLHRYRSEFDMLDIPPIVKKVIFPITRFFGQLAGKHKRFRDAPEAVR
jgi:quercetin dioxygenase-like cupin family protein